MKRVYKLIMGAVLVLAVVGCASQDEAPPTDEDVAAKEAMPVEPAEQEAAEPDALDEPGIAAFETADGTIFETNTIVELPTGGPPSGRLVPVSSSDEATLYVTRDGSLPSADNNWGGPIDPEDPPEISRPLEGVASYRVVAEIDGRLSEAFTLTVDWQHEESPDMVEPTFFVGGREVSGSVSIPVSDQTDPDAQLHISCRYASAMLYITRDGSEPSVDNNWEAGRCDGTYLWSPEPTAADYRVVAVWQGVQSPVASLRVEWVEQ